MKTFPCGLCQGERFTPLYEQRDRHRQHIRLVVCNRCGLSQLNPRRDGAEDAEFYTSTFYRLPTLRRRQDSKRWINRKNDVARGILDAVAEQRPLEGLRLLDVGCGNGFLLRQAQARGAKVCGVEPDVDSAEALRVEGFDVSPRSFLDIARSTSGPFDVVTMSHVVEHVNEPIPFLRAGAELLGPDGLLVAEVPNLRHQLEKGRYPRSAHAAHVYYHTDRSLRALFELSGLTVSAPSFGLGGKMVRAVGRPGPTRELVDLPLDDPEAIAVATEAAIARLRAEWYRRPDRLVTRAFRRLAGRA